MGKKNKDTITINRKAILWLLPFVPMIAVLLSNRDMAVFLLVIGGVCGFFAGRNFD